MFENMRLVILFDMLLNPCFKMTISFANITRFLIFKLPNVSNKEALSIRKILLCSTINQCDKEHQHLSKELSLFEKFLSKQLSTIDFYIVTKL